MTDNYQHLLAWLRDNRRYLNINNICKDIDVAASTMSKSLAGKNDVRGVAVRIPERALPELKKIAKSLGYNPPAISD